MHCLVSILDPLQKLFSIASSIAVLYYGSRAWKVFTAQKTHELVLKELESFRNAITICISLANRHHQVIFRKFLVLKLTSAEFKTSNPIEFDALEKIRTNLEYIHFNIKNKNLNLLPEWIYTTELANLGINLDETLSNEFTSLTTLNATEWRTLLELLTSAGTSIVKKAKETEAAASLKSASN